MADNDGLHGVEKSRDTPASASAYVVPPCSKLLSFVSTSYFSTSHVFASHPKHSQNPQPSLSSLRMSQPLSKRHASREDWVCHIFDTRRPLFAHVIGIPYKIELEQSVRPENVDHVWLTIKVPPCGEVLISVNTLSRLNAIAGFDPRVRAGVLTTNWEEKPEPMMVEFPGLDYATIESLQKIEFTHYEHEDLSDLLIAKGKAALRIEAWGELYRRDYLGMHQIHSRRASCAVPTDIMGKDGALRFYLPGGTAEMYLLKYCGQP